MLPKPRSTKIRFAISYADAFVVGLAQSLDGTILTGDPEINAIFMLRFLARPAQCEHSARTLLRVDATRFDVEGART